MTFIFPYIWNVIPIDFPIFQGDGLTTNQLNVSLEGRTWPPPWSPSRCRISRIHRSRRRRQGPPGRGGHGADWAAISSISKALTERRSEGIIKCFNEQKVPWHGCQEKYEKVIFCDLLRPDRMAPKGICSKIGSLRLMPSCTSCHLQTNLPNSSWGLVMGFQGKLL